MSRGELPEDEAEKARRRKQRKAQKNQYKVKEETLFYAGYVILITSLGAEYDREEILSLYRSRWQIELLFKRFKQNLSITTLRTESKACGEAVVLLWLLIWILTEKQIFLTEQFLRKKKEEQEEALPKPDFRNKNRDLWLYCQCRRDKMRVVFL